MDWSPPQIFPKGQQDPAQRFNPGNTANKTEPPEKPAFALRGTACPKSGQYAPGFLEPVNFAGWILRKIEQPAKKTSTFSYDLQVSGVQEVLIIPHSSWDNARSKTFKKISK
jgi:hypothetical protein